MSASYGQFCPLAKACEVVTERWTPLILRELLFGSQRFNEIHRGVPLMSKTLLSKRLQELERAGIIERVLAESGYDAYRLTLAGQELGPIVLQLGAWGKQWTKSQFTERELDAGLLMWDMRRRILQSSLPEGKIVVHFVYRDAPIGRNSWWLVMDRREVDLCLVDPGCDSDLTVTTSVAVMAGIWMGDRSMGADLQSGELKIEGDAKLRKLFPTWLLLSTAADIERRAG
ncbi:MAG: winged helix-turn-helix transcriptional regulator [Fimbriimonadaceae bacterium]|nr:winged helix-turn-helix transcriptional regulator [Fimbriimonadaceae bacterium]